ncbi:MAG: hypothetical protein J6Y23_10265 [Prevotella sp.]|nr:hypothetical protein [Prevotella sp.]
MKKWSLILITTLTALTTKAQHRLVVADKDTHDPIAQASIYTKENGKFYSAISNDQGEAVINFDFKRLTFSHLNYERKVVTILSDTIFLSPRYRETAEVIVLNIEPKWIREKLRQVVKTKQKVYFSQPRVLSYDYQTQSIDPHSYYSYQSKGLMQMKSLEHDRYSLSQTEGHIISVDSTRLTDVANLRRMLYEDFVDELDGGFINSHRFSENGEFNSANKNELELVFRSKKHNDDRGRIVIDTARCVIRSAYRITGTETNKRERMSPLLLSMARAISGYRVDKWNRTYHVSYAELSDGTMYPVDVSYKCYMEIYDKSEDPDEKNYDQQSGGGFPNMEATLHLSAAPSLPDSIAWTQLPGSWYLRLSSDKERQQEIKLSHLPAIFDIFREEDEN